MKEKIRKPVAPTPPQREIFKKPCPNTTYKIHFNVYSDETISFKEITEKLQNILSLSLDDIINNITFYVSDIRESHHSSDSAKLYVEYNNPDQSLLNKYNEEYNEFSKAADIKYKKDLAEYNKKYAQYKIKKAEYDLYSAQKKLNKLNKANSELSK